MDIPVFLINLPKDVARLEATLAECRKYGIEPVVIEGVNGAELTAEEMDKYTYDFENMALTRGDVGIALSHLKIYEKMIAENIDAVLILEDDIKFAEHINGAVSDVVAFNKTVAHKPFMYLLFEVKSYIKNNSIKLEHVTLYNTYRATLAHGYIINRKAAETLVAGLYPVRFSSDDWKFCKYALGVNIYSAEPGAVVADLYESNVAPADRKSLARARIKARRRVFTFRGKFMLFLSALARPFYSVHHNDKITSPGGKVKHLWNKLTGRKTT